jgi:hypothetical protein
MTCRVAVRLQPRYRVTFQGRYETTFSVLVRAEDSGSATLLGWARLHGALQPEPYDVDGAEIGGWSWSGTERVEG